MKINPNFSSFKVSSKGMSIQKKQMDLITENIANMSTTRTEDGTPYKRKFMSVEFNDGQFNNGAAYQIGSEADLKKTRTKHMDPQQMNLNLDDNASGLSMEEEIDRGEGELIYSPHHPDANEEGYVEMPNVNVVTEMVDMITASRSFEANLTAFNAAKQIAKDSLEI
ncbi:MAG: flagellar basal body rod protein FlgC [Ignavibacteriae bacterium]|nr:MAG: flagellar basal body rod protein FlgC [Ignavibacteriota bacterium]